MTTDLRLTQSEDFSSYATDNVQVTTQSLNESRHTQKLQDFFLKNHSAFTTPS